MSESKLAKFVKRLAEGKGSSTDPFSDDFFDRAEHERKLAEEEPRVVEEALQRARLKGTSLEREREQSKYREVVERPRYSE